MSSGIVDFYLTPLREAIDFYKQMLKYGNYDPDRYFKLNYGTLSAKEALSLSKPIFDAENSRLEKYYIDLFSNQIKEAIGDGKLKIELYIYNSLYKSVDQVVESKIKKCFIDLGYSFKYVDCINHTRSQFNDWTVEKLVISWKDKK